MYAHITKMSQLCWLFSIYFSTVVHSSLPPSTIVPVQINEQMTPVYTAVILNVSH